MNDKLLGTDYGYPIVALCYDFDKTLSPKDMQEYGFIDRLNMTPDRFWAKSNRLVKETGMDDILAYMYTMIKEAEKRDIFITEQDLRVLGRNIELFEGVESWFDRINYIGEKVGIIIEHYIISSGIKEIILGNKLAPHFKDIFASSFHYNLERKVVWPKQAVNFTTKTQYLFQINKNCDTDSVNDYMPDDERRIPFSHFIYIGDSATDIPCMRLVKSSGGNSIGVYNPENKGANADVLRLIKENRINYYACADYTRGSELERIVEKILIQIKAKHNLTKISKSQYKQAIGYSKTKVW